MELGNSLRDKYSWLIDRLKAKLPGEIVYQSFGWGLEFGIAYKVGHHRDAVLVERIASSTPLEYGDVEQEDGTTRREPVLWNHVMYSLNEDPNKEAIVEDIISKWKAL